MPRIPSLVKRLLVPLWNGGHYFAWGLGEYGGAILRGRVHRCEACGRVAPMLRRPRAVAPRLRELWGLSGDLAEAVIRKETLACALCGAKLRARRLARVLLDTFPTETPARSAREWVQRPEARRLRVAEINVVEGLHDELAKLPNLAFSDFEVAGVRHEDLTHLTYEDASFDLILTSETLEHVPDLAKALAEIRRVLTPGGWHLFTVPLLPDVPKTYSRIDSDEDGIPIHRHPPIRHPGGDVGYLVFTEFGADLPEILDAAGFETHVHFGPLSLKDVAQVFACRRRDDLRPS